MVRIMLQRAGHLVCEKEANCEPPAETVPHQRLVEAELVTGTARGDWTVTPEVHPPLSANHLSITPELNTQTANSSPSSCKLASLSLPVRTDATIICSCRIAAAELQPSNFRPLPTATDRRPSRVGDLHATVHHAINLLS
nr:hypothetical protein Iba_chr12cCG4730 [Ipomoea batatas]